MSDNTVLFIGATGCIGGSVLAALQKAYPNFTIKALVRNEASIEAFNNVVGTSSARVQAVKGSFEDSDLVARLAYESDFVINTADPDSAALRDGLLKGFKQRVDAGKPLGGYVHTSGTAIFLDGRTDGKSNLDGKVWTDDEADIRSLKEAQLHGPVDVALLKAQEEGYFNGFIICPTAVHGTGGGPLKKPSLMFKYLLNDATQRKRVAYIGEGTNIIGFVHVDDLVPLYLATFQRLVEAKGKKLASSPYERYVIAGREVAELKDLFAWMATTLPKLGKVDSPEPVSLTLEEAGPALAVLSQNALFRVGRAYSLGWKPEQPTITIKDTLTEDIMLTLSI